MSNERAGATVPKGQRASPQEDHRPHNLILHRVAHAGGVRPDQSNLERPSTIGRYGHGCQGAETGGDAVLGFALGQLLHHSPSGSHPVDRRRSEIHCFAVAGYCSHVVDRDAGAVELNGHDVKSSPLMRSSRASASTLSASEIWCSRRAILVNR